MNVAHWPRPSRVKTTNADSTNCPRDQRQEQAFSSNVLPVLLPMSAMSTPCLMAESFRVASLKGAKNI